MIRPPIPPLKCYCYHLPSIGFERLSVRSVPDSPPLLSAASPSERVGTGGIRPRSASSILAYSVTWKRLRHDSQRHCPGGKEIRFWLFDVTMSVETLLLPQSGHSLTSSSDASRHRKTFSKAEWYRRSTSVPLMVSARSKSRSFCSRDTRGRCSRSLILFTGF